MYDIILNKEKKRCCIYEQESDHSTFVINVDFKIDDEFVVIDGDCKSTSYVDRWIVDEKKEFDKLYLIFENVNECIVEKRNYFFDHFLMGLLFKSKEHCHLRGFLRYKDYSKRIFKLNKDFVSSITEVFGDG